MGIITFQMSITHAVMSALITLAAIGAAAGAYGADMDARLRADLERVAQLRIFFGHQSVGANLLDGVKQLAMTAGVPLRFVEVKAANEVTTATFGHAFVGENRKPLQKLQAFEQAMGQQPAGLDVAFVKFCYLDIDGDTDVKVLFTRYRATVDGIRARNPGTTFVHVTAPLTEAQRGIKAFVKQLLGRAPYGVIENARREEYNALLRQAYLGREPIFDLARIESTTPDGKMVTSEWKGIVAPALAPAFTDDGHHLNAAGKLRAGRELVSVMAAVPARAAASGPAR